MKRLLFILLSIILLCSCSKGTGVNKESFLSDITFSYEDKIDKVGLSYQYPSTIDKTKAFLVWTSSDKSVDIINAVYADAYFFLPESCEPKQVNITLLVSDGENSVTTTKEIFVPALNDVRKKGLGRMLEEEKSNNVDHYWYFDQMVSGKHSHMNCGPSVAAMAVKWACPNLTETPEDAREFIQPEGGAMHLHQLSPYLTKNKVTHEFVDGVSDIHILKEIINAGNIAIMEIKMFYISFQENNKWHNGRFYSVVPNDKYGHFIIVKGYKVVDGVTFYEVYDPFSNQKEYEDGQLMGIDRYFQLNELNKAFKVYHSYTTNSDLIVIHSGKS